MKNFNVGRLLRRCECTAGIKRYTDCTPCHWAFGAPHIFYYLRIFWPQWPAKATPWCALQAGGWNPQNCTIFFLSPKSRAHGYAVMQLTHPVMHFILTSWEDTFKIIVQRWSLYEIPDFLPLTWQGIVYVPVCQSDTHFWWHCPFKYPWPQKILRKATFSHAE
jgi:hypothetical protein